MLWKLVLLLSLIYVGNEIQAKSMRTTRGSGSGAAISVGGDIIGGFAGMALDNAFPVRSETRGDSMAACAYKMGCHRGYCWAGCDATAFNGEWCYTTRGYSQDFQYVRCSRDSDCDYCWKCAGSCTL